MKNIIATLVISTIILSMTIIGIELWRNNLELMRITAVKVDELEKIKRVNLVPMEKDQVLGGDVIAFIRYYRGDETVVVEVEVSGIKKSYIREGYNQENFNIPYEGIFKKTTYYEGNKLKKVSLILNLN